MPLTEKKISDLNKETRDGLYIYLMGKIYNPDTIRKEKQREELIDSAVFIDIISELLEPLIKQDIELVYSSDIDNATKVKVKKVNFTMD